MDGWMDEWMDGWIDEWMDGWMNGWMEEWTDRPTEGTAQNSKFKICATRRDDGERPDRPDRPTVLRKIQISNLRDWAHKTLSFEF